MSNNVDHFGPEVALSYDEDSVDMFAPEQVDPAVDLLASLAGSGQALELGIGTGRVALPLSRRGASGARHRPVGGHDRSTARQTGQRGDRYDHR